MISHVESFMRRLPVVVLFILATLACAASAQSVTKFADDFKRAGIDGISSLTVDIDNDSLLFNKDDRFYTSGVGISQSYAMRDQTAVAIFGWRIGQDIYTSSDVNLPPSQLAANDHPYAGWLYGGIFKKMVRADGSHAILGIDIGCLGPCAGGEGTQKILHRLINQPQPQGWSTQIRNEFGVVFYADAAPKRWVLARAVDITPTFGGRFGNIHTDINAGLTLRVGQLDILPGASTLHGFVRVNVRAVAYDATLQGGYFSTGNPHTVDPKRLVGQVEAGLAWTHDRYGLRASIVRRGNEIRDLPDSAGAQNFVRLQFIYTP